jgi:hypothetical protein
LQFCKEKLKSLEDKLEKIITEDDDTASGTPTEPAKHGQKLKDNLANWGSTTLQLKKASNEKQSPSVLREAIHEEILGSSSSSSNVTKKVIDKPPIIRDDIRQLAVANTPLSSGGYRLNTQDLVTQVLNNNSTRL